MHCWWEHTMVQPPWKTVGSFFYKTKPVIAIWPSNCTLRYLSQKNGNLCSHKNSWMNVQSSFIRNSQKPESVQISFNRWMSKQSVVYTHHAIWQSNKKKLTVDTHNNRTNLQRIILSNKKQIPKGYILYDPINRTFLKWQNLRNRE